jgi:uncharacterized protein YgiM (DUF1202 family)
MRTRLAWLGLALCLALGSLPLAGMLHPSGARAAGVSGTSVVQEAEKYIGYPYAYTGDSPATGFSCIGFVWYVYEQLGETIPGNLSSAMAAFPRVSESDLLPGDIIFFQNTWWAGVSHVAIYIGNGQIVHAANPQYGVTTSSLTNDSRDGNYWQDHYLVAERPWTGSAGVVVHRHHSRTRYVGQSELNLRAGPSLDDSILEILNYGTRLHIIKWSEWWLEVRSSSGATGWVIRSGTKRHVSQVTTQAPVHHSGDARAWEHAKRVYVNGLNVHNAPSLSAPIITSISSGRRVGIIQRSHGWDNVLLKGGISGWSVARLIGRHHSSRAHVKRVRKVATTSSFRGRAVPANIRIHSKPSLSAPTIGGTYAGMRVKVLGYRSGFAHILSTTGIKGWADAQLLGLHGGGRVHRHRTHVTHRVHKSHHRTTRVSSSGPYAKVTLRVHAHPTIAATVRGLIYPGFHVTVLAKRNGWDKIDSSTGIRGWVDAAYLT